MTEEHKRKIGLANKGKHLSPEALEKQRIAHLGKKWSEEARIRHLQSARRGEKNNKWKGDKVGIVGLHLWVRRKRGKPIECVYCGATEKLEWASISHHAKRDENDYISLCPKCHRNYDKPYKIMNEKQKRTLFKKGMIPWNKGKTYHFSKNTMTD